MGDQVYMLKDGEEISVEPTGDLLSAGWLPGTWVKYSSNPLTFSGALATVERSDGTGVIAGFLLYGPQHNRPVELQSDMWTTDTRQRENGDNSLDWTDRDASKALEFDKQGLLQRVGTRVVTMYIVPTGFHKFYVFETEDKAERNIPGSGSTLVYIPGDKLYVSENGLFTNEKESPFHVWTGYVVARKASDQEGDFMVVCAAMA